MDELENALDREQYLLRQLDGAKGISPDFYERCKDYYSGKADAEIFIKEKKS